MTKGTITANRRINVVLPETTVRLLDRVSKKGNRSRLINQAVKHYVESVSQQKLLEALKRGYARWTSYDRRVAEDWFRLEEEAVESLG